MTVSEQIINVINTLCEKFGIAVNWTNENIIPYLEILCGKLVKYEICTSVVWIVIMVLLSAGSIIIAKKLYPTFKKGLEEQGTYDCDWTIGTVFAITGLVLINLTAVIVIGTQIMDIVKCTTFPEMYIFEHVSNLLSSGN